MRRSMASLMDSADYAFAQQYFAWHRVLVFLDADSTSLNISLNIAHECIDRHAGDDARAAVRLALADGRDEAPTFREPADWSSRVRIGWEPMVSASENTSRSCWNPR